MKLGFKGGDLMAKKNDMTVKILMLGGRRCGKTSVLASMQNCFDKEFGSGNLTINIDDPGTMLDLNEKMIEIKGYFDGDHSENFSPDDNPTTEIRRYDLSISLKSKYNGQINFQFIDYPGEWVQDKAHLPELHELIKESHVFLIAIDTPHLMEQIRGEEQDGIGMYNDKHNRSSMISGLLKNELKADSEGKMILFVPLKCEKYKATNQMPLVKHKVKISYRELIDHLNNQYSNVPCTMAVTPIYTFGTVEFKRFKRDSESHEIIIEEKYKTPKYPLYGFMENAKGSPEPQYCEQPLVYILTFILATAKRIKEAKKARPTGIPTLIRKITITLGENFFNIPSADDYMKEIQNLKNKMVLGDGYEIITDPLEITKSGAQ